MKKSMKLLIFIFFTPVYLIFSQNTSQPTRYYLEIPNIINVPNVTKNLKNISLKFSNSTLTDLFNNYDITDFQLAFPGGKGALLENVYIIECDPKLIENISNNYSTSFGRWEEIQVMQLLYMPNDLGGTSTNPLPQPELSFINAPQAWDISKGGNVLLGNAEGAYILQEDLASKITNLTFSSSCLSHGTNVASVAAAITDNGLGIASIGFNPNYALEKIV